MLPRYWLPGWVRFQRKKKFKSIVIMCIIALFTSSITIFKLIDKAVFCSPIEQRLIAMPDGLEVPLFTTELEIETLADHLKECQYVHDKINCGSVTNKGKSIGRQLQLSIGRLLRIIDLMAEKYHFKYWLNHGTLLDAMRSGRIMPWIDDGDISMMRKDYEVFIRHAKYDLPDNVFLQTSTTDFSYGKVQLVNEAKLRDVTTCYGYCLRHGCSYSDGYQVDIKVFDFVDEDIILEKYGMEKYYYRDIFPLSTKNLEGFQFMVPGKSVEMLTKRYGDFQKFPIRKKQCMTFVGIPWSSCDGLLAMNSTYRDYILTNTIMTILPKLSKYIL